MRVKRLSTDTLRARRSLGRPTSSKPLRDETNVQASTCGDVMGYVNERECGRLPMAVQLWQTVSAGGVGHRQQTIERYRKSWIQLSNTTKGRRPAMAVLIFRDSATMETTSDAMNTM